VLPTPIATEGRIILYQEILSSKPLVLQDIATKILKDMCPVASQRSVNSIFVTAEIMCKYLKLNIRTSSCDRFGSQFENAGYV
jgi:hypothetical protein